MVLTVGPGPAGGPGGGAVDGRTKVIPIHESDAVAIYAGAQPPRERIMSSRDFAANLTRLAVYLARLP